ncbi:uncharacterized protein LOC143219685 [Lasioglossum baleicum]|uniref:uncharacterized protein LOC143219685 n=1 Tax=Lasioglossum baleicum TaxID=434251 RepID=UPI003FCE640E
MTTAVSLVTRQLDLHGRISRTIVNTKKKGMANITESYIQARLDVLQRNWDDFLANHAQLQDLCTAELLQHEYFTENLCEQCEAIVVDTQATLCDMLKDLSPRGSDSTGETSARGHTTTSAKLRRIDVPDFSGEFKDWPLFKSLFTSLVLNNAGLDETEKFHYLLRSLSGEALDLIRNVPVDGDQFELAWEIIVGQYENTRILVDNLLDTLYSLAPAKSESATELKRVRVTVKQILGALEVLNCQVQHWGPFVIFWVSRRLDPETLKAWELLIADQTDYPEYAVLDKFIQSRIRALSTVDNAKSGAIPQKPRTVNTYSHATATFKSRCILCTAPHYVGSCPRFLSKSTAERKQFIMQQRRCYNCLGNHPLEACRSSKRCLKCTSPHHTSLHDGSDAASKSSSAKSAPTGESASAASHHVTPVSPKVSLHRPILLATALVDVVAATGERFQARVLLDQGSEVSFITESLCQRLRLPRLQASLPIYGIGAGHTVTTRGVSIVAMSSRTETYTCKVKAFILPQLTHYAPTVATPHANWTHLQGLSSIIQPDIRRGDDNAPVAQLTKLGWILSGPAASTVTTAAFVGASSFQCGVDQDLYDLIQKFWVQEEPSNQIETTRGVPLWT